MAVRVAARRWCLHGWEIRTVVARRLRHPRPAMERTATALHHLRRRIGQQFPLQLILSDFLVLETASRDSPARGGLTGAALVVLSLGMSLRPQGAHTRQPNEWGPLAVPARDCSVS